MQRPTTDSIQSPSRSGARQSRNFTLSAAGKGVLTQRQHPASTASAVAKPSEEPRAGVSASASASASPNVPREEIQARLLASLSGAADAGTDGKTPPAGLQTEDGSRVDDMGLLTGSWQQETRLGQDGPAREVGVWLQDNWGNACDIAANVGGLLAGTGCESGGGPPDRLKAIDELEEITGDSKAASCNLNCPRASALHAAFGLLFWVHQEAITFDPNMSMTAAGQKTSSASEIHFTHMVKSVNLAQQIARDIRNLAYGRYGTEKYGLKEASRQSRDMAEQIRKHSATIKSFINDMMVGSIGLSTGGA